jgi:hypothetical protein
MLRSGATERRRHAGQWLAQLIQIRWSSTTSPAAAPGVDVSSYSINGAVLGFRLLHARRQPAGDCGKQYRRHHPHVGDSRRWRGRVSRRDAEHAGLLPERRRGRHQPGEQVRRRPVPWRRLRSFPSRHSRRQRLLQQAKPVVECRSGDRQSAPYNTPPSFHRYQEGGSIGGPILHKKLFFFGDYEATQQELFDGSNYFSVPTTAERTGDFSADSYTIYDPTQPDVATGPLAGTRQPVAGNKIANPNPIALKYLSEFPKCNYPSPSTCEAVTTPVPVWRNQQPLSARP